jgi:arylsulfatase A-like enzyme
MIFLVTSFIFSKAMHGKKKELPPNSWKYGFPLKAFSVIGGTVKAAGFLCLAGALLLNGIIVIDGKLNSPVGPDIVFIIIDTLRADHMECYGYRKKTAPFISKIASKGIVFENAFAASSWTAPATSSIFTSLYPFQHGVLTGFHASMQMIEKNPSMKINRIPAAVSTLPEIMKNTGYKTFAITDNLNICEDEGFAVGFDFFRNFDYKGAGTVNTTLLSIQRKMNSHHPYFLYLHYNDPHTPYHSRAPWFIDSGNHLKRFESAYDSEISFTDDKIKRLFTKMGWDKNTLVIITADHGEEFGEHGGEHHGMTLYSEVIHVPLILYFPDGNIVPKRIAEPVSTIDIMPSIEEFVGLEPDSSLSGTSFFQLISGNGSIVTSGKYTEKRKLFSHLLRKKEEFGKNLEKKAVMDHEWKYIDTTSGYDELYNLRNDPAETWNKINEHRGIADTLLESWNSFEKTCIRYSGESFSSPLTQERIDDLRSLGYLQ